MLKSYNFSFHFQTHFQLLSPRNSILSLSNKVHFTPLLFRSHFHLAQERVAGSAADSGVAGRGSGESSAHFRVRERGEESVTDMSRSHGHVTTEPAPVTMPRDQPRQSDEHISFQSIICPHLAFSEIYRVSQTKCRSWENCIKKSSHSIYKIVKPY